MTGNPVTRIAKMPARAGGVAVASAITALAGSGQSVARLLRGRYPTVAVTGMTGVGKTRLADRLSRTSTPEAEVGSAVLERRTRRAARLHGFRFRVVPGENAATRLGALDHVFNEEPVDGILHVVAYGHATPRRRAGTTGRAKATREQQLAAELEDWTITAHRLASMAVRRNHPTWLVIAVTKADLYPDQIDEAVQYYSPGSGSPFADRLDELRTLAGAAKLSVDVLPVCSQGGDKRSAMPGKRCDTLLAALEARMGQLSGHV